MHSTIQQLKRSLPSVFMVGSLLVAGLFIYTAATHNISSQIIPTAQASCGDIIEFFPNGPGGFCNDTDCDGNCLLGGWCQVIDNDCPSGGNPGGGTGGSCTPSSATAQCPAGETGLYTTTINADCSTTYDYTGCVPIVNCPDGTPAPNNDASQCPVGPGGGGPKPTNPPVTLACPDQYQWVDCSGRGFAGDPPSSGPYSDSVIYHYTWDNDPGNEGCALQGAGVVTMAPSDQECPTPPPPPPPPPPPQASIISIINNTTGAWSILNGFNGSGTNPGQTVTPDNVSGTTYTIAPASVSGYSFPPKITNNITGNSPSFTLFGGETANFTLTYTPAAGFNYSLSNSGNTTLQAGASAQVTINELLVSGPSQGVTLSASGLPSGVSQAFSVCSPGGNPTCTSTLTLTADGSTPAGNYTVTVTGTSAGVSNKITTFNLIVTAPAFVPSGPGGTSGNPNPASTSQQVTWTSCNAAGGIPPYTYHWSGTDVANLTTPSNVLTYAYTTPGTKTMNVMISDSSSPEQNVSCAAGTVKVVLNAKFQEF